MKTTRVRPSSVICSLFVASGCSLFGCSASAPENSARLTPQPPAASAAGGGDGSSIGQSGSGGLNVGNQPGVITVPVVPVDVFMMVDQSISMALNEPSGQTRWASVIAALTQFVQAPQSAGLGIGVQYFGLGLLGTSCNAPDYAMPEVEIGALPGNATAIVNSFAMHMPSSVTPTAPALQGAIMHAQAYKLMNPTHAVVVLLVTDGEPDSCGSDFLADTVNAAMTGVQAMPPINTYVLGVGTSLDALNQIAAAGGTQQAYIVMDGMNVSDEVVMALNKIRGQAVLPCEFQIPAADPGKNFDYDKVNLSYTAPGGKSMVVGYATDVAKCNAAAMAWRYDNPAAPTKIELCDTTCKAITMTGGSISIALHCPTIPVVLN